MALQIKVNLRHLFLAIPFESRTRDDPLLKAVVFLKKVFRSNTRIKDFSRKSFPTECIPKTLRKYLYDKEAVKRFGRPKDLITNEMAKLAMFKYFNIEENTLWGAIDGLNIETQLETFNALHSSKYFRPRKGVSSISLIVNHIAPNARIISSHDHEGHFAYDLVFNNTSEVNPNRISSDRHGDNRINHALLNA